MKVRRRVIEQLETPLPFNALESCKALTARYGFVVIGYPPDALNVEHPGDTVSNFGHYLIEGHRLLLKTSGTRADWERQFKVLFPDREDKNVEAEGEIFYRCELVEKVKS